MSLGCFYLAVKLLSYYKAAKNIIELSELCLVTEKANTVIMSRVISSHLLIVVVVVPTLFNELAATNYKLSPCNALYTFSSTPDSLQWTKL